MSGVSINTSTGEVTTFVATPVMVPISVKQQEARNLRDAALRECDWTQMPDVTLANASNWTSYRQALRDVSLDPNWSVDPVSVVKTVIAGKPV